MVYVVLLLLSCDVRSISLHGRSHCLFNQKKRFTTGNRMGIIFGQEVGLTQVCFDRDSLGVIVELEDAIVQEIFSQKIKRKKKERKM